MAPCCAARVMLGLFATAFADPQINLGILAVSTVGTAFASATQDIALDAYRIESADSRRQAAYAAMYQAGYRMGMIWREPVRLHLLHGQRVTHQVTCTLHGGSVIA